MTPKQGMFLGIFIIVFGVANWLGGLYWWGAVNNQMSSEAGTALAFGGFIWIVSGLCLWGYSDHLEGKDD